MTESSVAASSQVLEYLGLHFSTIPYRVAEYQRLLEIGWSHNDIVLATKTGYSFALHVRQELQRRNYKWAADSKPFYAWLQHYYRLHQAEKAGIEFAEFLERWCELWEWRRSSSGRMVQDMLGSYMRARKGGLKHHEAKTVAIYFGAEDRLYIALRRKLNSRLTTELVYAYRHANARNACDPPAKSILEALRRGTSFDDVVNAVRSNTITQMALAMRYHQRSSVSA